MHCIGLPRDAQWPRLSLIVMLPYLCVEILQEIGGQVCDFDRFHLVD
jgi:hypothetical protein